MTPAEVAAEKVRGQLGTLPVGALRMFGDWFGRPYDNQHRCVSAQAVGGVLTLGFDEGEELIVSGPRGWTFDAATLPIDGADSVRWRWFLYGKPRERANLRTIEHRVGEGGLHARTDAEGHVSRRRQTPSHPAVEIVGPPIDAMNPHRTRLVVRPPG